ncbi:unnamed protein product [Ectocarpus sp. 12 AP-2014]
MRSAYCPSTTAVALVAAACLPLAVGFNSIRIAHEQHQRHFGRSPEWHSGIIGRGETIGHARPSTARECASRGAEVALTREAGKNGKLAKLLTDAGISSVEVPCIAHQDGPDLPLLPAALADPGLAYVVVTSPEAARVFLAGWAKAGVPGVPVPVACVGKATGDALRAGGVSPVFTPSKATGETLAAEIPLPPSTPADDTVAPAAAPSEAEEATGAGGEGRSSSPGGGPRVLYPASVKAQNTLESGLRTRGFEVRRLNTYDTVPATWDESAEAAAAGASVAAFGSPSAVKTWAARMGVVAAGERGAGAEGSGGGKSSGGGALAACIGETSARACREAGWAESAIFYPEKPGMEGWAKAVGEALAAVETLPSSPDKAGASAW